MKPTIKIIKRNQHDDANKPTDTVKSVEQGTREMVGTVKSWIAELQQKKRAEVHSFPGLPMIVIAPRSEYLETVA